MLVVKVEDLIIYQIAVELAVEMDNLVNEIPYYWDVKEVGQIRRSSSSVAANISEGFGNRFYHKKYVHYLNISIGSSDESKTHLEILFKKSYIKEAVFKSYYKRYKNLSVKILNLINYEIKKHNLKN